MEIFKRNLRHEDDYKLMRLKLMGMKLLASSERYRIPIFVKNPPLFSACPPCLVLSIHFAYPTLLVLSPASTMPCSESMGFCLSGTDWKATSDPEKDVVRTNAVSMNTQVKARITPPLNYKTGRGIH